MAVSNNELSSEDKDNFVKSVYKLDVAMVEKYLALGVDPNSGAGTHTVPLIKIVKYPWAEEHKMYGYMSEEEIEKVKNDASFLEMKHQLKSAETIFYLLLENNADPNIKDNLSETPLMVASDVGNDAAVQVLLNKGAEINLRDKKGKTALLNAVNSKHWGLVLTLIKNGADVTVSDDSYK